MGFLEGGVAWACSLYADLIGHWEKRNSRTIGRLDPDRLDVGALLELLTQHGGTEVVAERERIRAHLAQPAARPERLDEFDAVGLSRADGIRDRFVPNFYFGCEADDPLVARAFSSEANPLGARMRAMLGSDISHWDVVDMTDPIAEACESVEKGTLTEDDFREFAFLNAIPRRVRYSRRRDVRPCAGRCFADPSGPIEGSIDATRSSRACGVV